MHFVEHVEACSDDLTLMINSLPQGFSAFKHPEAAVYTTLTRYGAKIVIASSAMGSANCACQPESSSGSVPKQ